MQGSCPKLNHVLLVAPAQVRFLGRKFHWLSLRQVFNFRSDMGGAGAGVEGLIVTYFATYNPHFFFFFAQRER